MKLKGSTKLFADETTAPVLDPGRGRTKTGQLWAYARDDRPWGGTDPPGVAYVYAPDRKAERPIAHLAGFTGILQVDGYGGYRVLAERGDVKLAFCWCACPPALLRARRRRPGADRQRGARAHRRLYRIESEIRGRSADERRAVRQEKSRPIIEALEPWLREKLGLISQKTKLAEAIRYALSRWEGLTRFLDDGRIEIDNNVVERAIRPIALNRKNALFAGSDGGGEHWAIIASLIETCKLNGIDPHAYLADVITRIVNGHPNSQHRRAPAVGLRPIARPQSRGLRTALTAELQLVAKITRISPGERRGGHRKRARPTRQQSTATSWSPSLASFRSRPRTRRIGPFHGNTPADQLHRQRRDLRFRARPAQLIFRTLMQGGPGAGGRKGRPGL